MCTAVTYKTNNHYFGRNLDLEYSYNETVTITPRNYVFAFRKMESMESHFAIIGMAYVSEGYPLYYDATNEKGLSIAGLNFPGNADYKPYCGGKDNITPFELIPWILGQCASVSETEKLLERINLWDENFSEELPLSPLHWIIADKERSITLESVKTGIRIYENPIGVLTNDPTFDNQMFHLNYYLNHNKGVPGDTSSMSRFVRAAFVKQSSVSSHFEKDSVSQFFHILKSVEMQRGCVKVDKGIYKITRYSSCCNTDRGIYYYSTYDNSSIYAVDMYREDLQGNTLVAYPLKQELMVTYQN